MPQRVHARIIAIFSRVFAQLRKSKWRAAAGTAGALAGFVLTNF
jgi:hypothetical protein